MIYYAMFIVSSFFFYLGERSKNKDRFFFDTIAISFPLFMATFRDETVGIDVATYLKPMYLCAEEAVTFAEYHVKLASQLSTRDLEFGFTTLGFVGTKVFHSICGVFFIDELVMLIFVYLAIRKYNAKISKKYNLPKIKLSIAMFCYLALFYNMSLSMMRQSMACSLILYCVISFSCDDYLSFVLSFLCSVLMHSTAAVGILFFFLSLTINRKRLNALREMIIPLGLICALLGGRFYWAIMKLLNYIFPVPERYLSYEYMWNQGNGINLAFAYLIICSFFCIWMLRFRKNKNNLFLIFLEYVAWFTVFLTPMSVSAANVSRILYYFFYFFIFLISMTANMPTRIAFKYKICVPFVFCSIYWVGCVLLNDYSGTLKYMARTSF